MKLGDIIYYVEDGMVYSAKVTYIDNNAFELEGYGCCCEGTCTINKSMLGYTFFENREDAEKHLEYL